jgi:hypothetical protein
MMNCLHQSDLRITRSTWVIAVLLVLISSSRSTSQNVADRTPAQQQARLELNAAAAAYREGDFFEAQRHSEKALAIDLENRVAPLFIARTIHAQYKPGDFSPDNLSKAREAISAYQRILAKDRFEEESYKAIAYLYGALKEDDLLNDWLLTRAADTSFPADKRAEAYIVLSSKYWDCSFNITELPTNKITTIDPSNDEAKVSYRKPKVESDFKNANQCATQGLQFAELAITLEAENESAWSYKTNPLLEMAKLSEMSGDMEQQSLFLRQYKEALQLTTKISESTRQKRKDPDPEQFF